MTKKQTQMLVLLQDLVLAFVINGAATVLGGGFVATDLFLVGMFQAFCINYIAGIIIPVERAGRAVAGALHLKDGTLPHKLVRIFIVNAIFVTTVSFGIALLNVGVSSSVFPIWWSTYPVLHLVGYLTSLLIEKPCTELAKTFVDS